MSVEKLQHKCHADINLAKQHSPKKVTLKKILNIILGTSILGTAIIAAPTLADQSKWILPGSTIAALKNNPPPPSPKSAQSNQPKPAKSGWILNATLTTKIQALNKAQTPSSKLNTNLNLKSETPDASGRLRVMRSQRPISELFLQGTIVSTGFSGITQKLPVLPATLSKEERLKIEQSDDYRFIDLNGYSSTLLYADNLKNTYSGLEIKDRPYDQILSRDVGQVFGIAIDDDYEPNLYLTATSMFGLQIVGADKNRDRVPDRLKSGDKTARWMNGQWGAFKHSGPGSVYKVDGKSGQIEHFANIKLNDKENSGAALGNIAYDSVHEQFFVSDLETGMIHRLDMDGKQIEYFDHGKDGRPSKQLAALEFDPNSRFSINDSTFDPLSSATWNFSPKERRVWGVSRYAGRLFYAVAEGPSVWSIGLDKETGAFLNDPRWELTVNDDHPDYDISDIVFSPQGEMILAQRGKIVTKYDYSDMAETGSAELLRYVRESPKDDPTTPSVWYEKPDILPVGFEQKHNNGLGGIALGPGYDERGLMDWHYCNGTLWSSGDSLRINPDLQPALLQGGRSEVDGIQAIPRAYPSYDNRPPWLSYFHDYDGDFPETTVKGWIGDVEVLGCKGGAGGIGGFVETEPPLLAYNYFEDAYYNDGTPTNWCTANSFNAGLCYCQLFPGSCKPTTEQVACAKTQANIICDPKNGTYVLNAAILDLSGSGLDSALLEDPSGTIASLPKTASYPGNTLIDLTGVTSGQTGQVNVCAFNAAEQASGNPYSCCKATINFKVPGEACEITKGVAQ